MAGHSPVSSKFYVCDIVFFIKNRFIVVAGIFCPTGVIVPLIGICGVIIFCLCFAPGIILAGILREIGAEVLVGPFDAEAKVNGFVSRDSAVDGNGTGGGLVSGLGGDDHLAGSYARHSAVCYGGNGIVGTAPSHGLVRGVIGLDRCRERDGLALLHFGGGTLVDGDSGHRNNVGTHGYCAGCGLAAIDCGDSDGGGAFLHGGHYAVGDGGYGIVRAAPAYVIVVGIDWSDGGGELGGLSYLQRQGAGFHGDTGHNYLVRLGFRIFLTAGACNKQGAQRDKQGFFHGYRV